MMILCRLINQISIVISGVNIVGDESILASIPAPHIESTSSQVVGEEDNLTSNKESIKEKTEGRTLDYNTKVCFRFKG